MSDIAAFVVHMRHELRTPINAILGYSQLLIEETEGSPFTATDRRDLERIADAGRLLLRIVAEVLDPVAIDVDTITAFAARLRHAIRTPLTTAQGYVEMLLEEHGAGTAGDDLRRIETASRRLTELVDTIEHTYRVRVGAAGVEPLSAPADATRAADALETGTETATSGGTILVIDDEEANRALLIRRLARAGHSVLTAETGEEGIAIAANQPVDAILLDVVMPGLSGYEVLARLKQDAGLRDIPVLMITAIDGSASVMRCITLGADDCLPKPFDPVVLSARVAACVAKKRARDFELAYLRGVAKVTEAAAAVERGEFVPSTLDPIASRPDALGNLARLFQRMAVEVAARERRLEAQLYQLTIAIDERKKAVQVQEITDSDYFRDLKARAHHFSARRAARPGHID